MMNLQDEIRVVGWIGFDDCDARCETKYETSIGGLGGWFGQQHTWIDYCNALSPNELPYAEALRKAIVEEGHWISGEEHQNASNGTPLFSDGTIGSFSFRSWGDLMAAISFSVDGKPRSYMDWYYLETDIPDLEECR